MTGRFLTDSSLAGLARRLRVLGYDAEVLAGEGLSHVCEVARAERRVVLTMSRRVPPACAFVERFVVRRDDPEASLRELASRYDPAGPPFSRCSHCNILLVETWEPRDLDTAPVRPPAHVRVTGHCPSCHRCYWHGDHVDRLREWMARVLPGAYEP